MPIYEYQCEGCGQVFEVLQRYSDPAPDKHDACGSTALHRIMSPSAFVFKGDGWYITDYARKEKKDSAGSKGSSSSGSSSGSGSSSSSGGSSGSGSGSTDSGSSSKGTAKSAAA